MSDFLNFSIQTRTEFRNWILRQLGYPTITPELTKEQLDDCIDTALEEFTEYSSGITEYFALNLRDYVAGKGYIMPSNVAAVTELYDQGVNGCSQYGINPFSMNMMAMNGGMTPNPFGGLASRSRMV